MSVRRRESRLEIGNASGVLRVWQDVSAHRTQNGDYLVISSQARSKGERLTMYLVSSDGPVHVRVLDSRPTLLEGTVRHQLRLQPMPDDASGTHGETRDDLETK